MSRINKSYIDRLIRYFRDGLVMYVKPGCNVQELVYEWLHDDDRVYTPVTFFVGRGVFRTTLFQFIKSLGFNVEITAQGLSRPPINYMSTDFFARLFCAIPTRRETFFDKDNIEVINYLLAACGMVEHSSGWYEANLPILTTVVEGMRKYYADLEGIPDDAEMPSAPPSYLEGYLMFNEAHDMMPPLQHFAAAKARDEVATYDYGSRETLTVSDAIRMFCSANFGLCNSLFMNVMDVRVFQAIKPFLQKYPARAVMFCNVLEFHFSPCVNRLCDEQDLLMYSSPNLLTEFELSSGVTEWNARLLFLSHENTPTYDVDDLANSKGEKLYKHDLYADFLREHKILQNDEFDVAYAKSVCHEIFKFFP